MELSSVEDESTLFSIVRNGKSSLQVHFHFFKFVGVFSELSSELLANR